MKKQTKKVSKTYDDQRFEFIQDFMKALLQLEKKHDIDSEEARDIAFEQIGLSIGLEEGMVYLGTIVSDIKSAVNEVHALKDNLEFEIIEATKAKKKAKKK